MSDRAQLSQENSRLLIVAITDFLRDQLNIREDLLPEDRDCLEIAIQCLEMAYGLDPNGYMQLRPPRPLLDIFQQVTHPVPVRDKIRADAHKEEGNEYMRRNMYQNAEAEYTSAISLDKWNSIYYCNRAGARIEQRNYYDAIADCRQAMMLNPDYAKAYGRMGQAYALLNRPREAARHFRRALELDPRNESYRNNLGVAESQVNRPDIMGIVSGVLNSIFGTESQTAPRVSSTPMPPSFMIISERPNPARDASQSNTQPQNESEETGTERNVPVNPLHGFSFLSNTARDATQRNTQPAQNDRETTGTGRNVPVNPFHGFSFLSNPARDTSQRNTQPAQNCRGTTGTDRNVRGNPFHDFPFSRLFGMTDSNPTRSPNVQEDPSSDTEDDEEVDLEIVITVPEHFVFPDVVPARNPRQEGFDFTGRDAEKGKTDNTSSCEEKHNSIHTATHEDGDDLSLGLQNSSPNAEKGTESSELSAPENSDNIATDTSKAQDTDSKHIPSNETEEKSFVERWPTEDEWKKNKDDDGRDTVAGPSDKKSPSAEKNVDPETANESKETDQRKVQTPVPAKPIRSESELFESIKSHHKASNVSERKEKNENLDEKSKVTDENVPRDESDDSN